MKTWMTGNCHLTFGWQEPLSVCVQHIIHLRNTAKLWSVVARHRGGDEYSCFHSYLFRLLTLFAFLHANLEQSIRHADTWLSPRKSGWKSDLACKLLLYLVMLWVFAAACVAKLKKMFWLVFLTLPALIKVRMNQILITPTRAVSRVLLNWIWRSSDYCELWGWVRQRATHHQFYLTAWAHGGSSH